MQLDRRSPNGIMPMTVAVPPGRSMANACSAVCLQADRLEGVVARRRRSAPAPGRPASPAQASTRSVAPNCSAISSFVALRSTAMIRPAPAMAAPCTQLRPMPPQPMTATVEPGSTCGGAEHRADAGGDAAADERGAVERHVVADLHQRVLVHEHLLGERAAVDELVHRLRRSATAVAPRPSRPAALRRLAQRRAARQAVLAVAAEHRQAGDDVVAGLRRR